MTHDVQAALPLTAVLLDWCVGSRGPFTEATVLIDKVFALPGASANTISRARVLCEAGFLMLFNGETGKAQTYEEACLVLSQEANIRQRRSGCLTRPGRIAHSGWYDQDVASLYLERALASYRTLEDPGGIFYATVLLGEIALIRADFPRACALCRECLVVAQAAGFTHPWPWMILSNIASAEGDLDDARSLHEEVLGAVQRQREGKAIIAYTLTELGFIATRQGDFTAAHAFLDEAVALWKELSPESMVASDLTLAELFQAEGDYRRGVQAYRRTLAGIEHDPTLWGLCLLSLADLTEALGQHDLTARLLGATEAAVDVTGYRLFPEQA